MKVKTIVQVVLLLAIIALSVLMYMSIKKPVKYEEAFNERKESVVNKLKDIRTFEGIYKSANGQFANNFDSLTNFVLNGKVPMLKKTGNVPDSLTEEQALKMGLVSRDTVYVSVKEQLKNEKVVLYFVKDYAKDVPNLKYIPFTERKAIFNLDAGTVSKGNVKVPVFECNAEFKDFLIGLDEGYTHNKISDAKALDRFPGWKVGSMDEPLTDGNWE